jgi:hypothetical protein
VFHGAVTIVGRKGRSQQECPLRSSSLFWRYTAERIGSINILCLAGIVAAKRDEWPNANVDTGTEVEIGAGEFSRRLVGKAIDRVMLRW